MQSTHCDMRKVVVEMEKDPVPHEAHYTFCQDDLSLVWTHLVCAICPSVNI